MKIIAYTSSLNDKEALRRCLACLLNQTHPIEEIIVVDNGSTDGTHQEPFPNQVTFIRHERNLGTSGAVATAFKYALAKNYDWMWVLDQDSAPHRDALERLVQLYRDLPPDRQDRVGILGCLPVLDPEKNLSYVHFLTPTGTKLVKTDPNKPYHRCDTTIWSGSMYNLDAVREVGLPRFGLTGYWEDFNLDWGDLEFGYRIKRAGYEVFVHPSSLMDHPVGKVTEVSKLGRRLWTSNHLPFRRYLYFRNGVYFWLYLHPTRRLAAVAFHLVANLAKTIVKISLVEDNRLKKIRACVQGAWDGLRKKLHNNFSGGVR